LVNKSIANSLTWWRM